MTADVCSLPHNQWSDGSLISVAIVAVPTIVAVPKTLEAVGRNDPPCWSLPMRTVL